ncbi:GTP-binding protein, putative [Plasmodium vinckei lentum]|uniref:GTP-binding protein, putative n=1 Tax=Plasmodium vinckei lentum TaxID=138297 RepID=A0A6V7RSM1_PLAVN|nr:GTP-binding protein, putative [Plasmodium vinckei lentum]
MINKFKQINGTILKNNTILCGGRIFPKSVFFYSIKIINKENKQDIKTYGHNKNGKKNKKNDNEDDSNTTHVCENIDHKGDLIKCQNNLVKFSRSKSIFYESERIIKCESGAGGDGAFSFKKFKRKVFGNLGIPNGGKGGDGGSIYLCYSSVKGNINHKNVGNKKNDDQNKYIFINNLSELPCAILATNGGKGKANQLRGKNGTNIFLYLNKVCHVYKILSDQNDKSNKDNINENDLSDENEVDSHKSFQTNLDDNIKLEKKTNEENTINENLYEKKEDNLIYYKSNYEENVYNIIKKEDPVYLKRNQHILKQIKTMDQSVRKETYIGLLCETNNCILLSKGGMGGKGNNMQNTFSFEKGQSGDINYIRVVYKCISDICFIGYDGVGKSTLLSLITHQIHTVNNLYILKKIFFKDNYQISVADFFSEKNETSQNDKRNNITFNINPNFIKYMELTHLLVIILDANMDIVSQFCSIREELKRKDEHIYQKPYIVVINKCDLNFKEKMNKVEEAYKGIKNYDNNVPIFFVSAKYGMGITEFVNCLRNSVHKLKHNDSFFSSL